MNLNNRINKEEFLTNLNLLLEIQSGLTLACIYYCNQSLSQIKLKYISFFKDLIYQFYLVAKGDCNKISIDVSRLTILNDDIIDFNPKNNNPLILEKIISNFAKISSFLLLVASSPLSFDAIKSNKREISLIHYELIIIKDV